MGESWSPEEGQGCRRGGGSSTAMIGLPSWSGCPDAGVVADAWSQGRRRVSGVHFFLLQLLFASVSGSARE
jgi:hypothetical protein